MADPTHALATLARADQELARAEWLTVKAYALVYGVDRGTVYKWLRSGGVLHTYRVGSLRRIRNVPPAENHAARVDGC